MATRRTLGLFIVLFLSSPANAQSLPPSALSSPNPDPPGPLPSGASIVSYFFAPTLAVFQTGTCDGAAIYSHTFGNGCDELSIDTGLPGVPDITASASVVCSSTSSYSVSVFASGSCSSGNGGPVGAGTSGACDTFIPTIPLVGGLSASVTCKPTPLFYGVIAGGVVLILLCCGSCVCCCWRRSAAAAESRVVVLQESLLSKQGSTGSVNASVNSAWEEPPTNHSWQSQQQLQQPWQPQQQEQPSWQRQQSWQQAPQPPRQQELPQWQPAMPPPPQYAPPPQYTPPVQWPQAHDDAGDVTLPSFSKPYSDGSSPTFSKRY